MVRAEHIRAIQQLESDARLASGNDEQIVLLSESATRELSKTIERLIDDTSPYRPERLETLDHVLSGLMERFSFDDGSYVTESELAKLPANRLGQTRLGSRLQSTTRTTNPKHSVDNSMNCHDLHHWSWELDSITHHDYRSLIQGECLRCGRNEEKELIRSNPTISVRKLQAKVTKIRADEPAEGRCLDLSADIVHHLHELGVAADIRRFKVLDRTHHAVVADTSKVDTEHDWMLVDASLDQFNPDLPFEAGRIELLQPEDDKLEVYTPDGISKYGPGSDFVKGTALFA
jgi:hypothetical protein